MALALALALGLALAGLFATARAQSLETALQTTIQSTATSLPGIEILQLDPASHKIDLANASYLLEDPTGKLSLAQVQQPANASRFQRKLPNIGFSASAWWLRFTVVSKASQPVIWWLHSNNRTLQEISVHTPDAQGHYQIQSASANLPFAQRPLPTPEFVFPLTLHAQQTTDIYLRVRSTGFLGVLIAPELWQPNALLANESRKQAQWIIYMGMVMALGLFNFMLCLAIKQQYYLLYTASVVGVGWSICSGSGGFGSAFEYFWPDSPLFEQSAWLMAVLASSSTNILFFFKFTRLHSHLPRIGSFLQICLGLLSVLLAIQITATIGQWPDSAQLLQNLYVFSCIIFASIYATIATGLTILASRSNRQAQYLCVAWGPAIVSVTVWALYAFLGKKFNIAFAMWASAFELIFMSLAMADLFNEIKRAKRKAQAGVVELLTRSKQELAQKVANRTLELEQRQAHTKQLLHNILPLEIAKELSETGRAQTARHESVTILFTDFIGFTQTISALPPDELVSELNDIFAAFDDITDACGVEKIKTIGDIYMAVAGLPKPCADHAQRCVRAAIMMVDYLEQRNLKSAAKWSIRVGIHSGPVVAGVVGKRKFAFDIWGDTVNIASRMESAGEDGRINVSAYTCDLIQNDFECQYRGKLDAKGKGEVDMYFVTKILQHRNVSALS